MANSDDLPRAEPGVLPAVVGLAVNRASFDPKMQKQASFEETDSSGPSNSPRERGPAWKANASMKTQGERRPSITSADDVAVIPNAKKRSSTNENGEDDLPVQVKKEKKQLFVDQDAMKKKLIAQMSKPKYDVTVFYKNTGLAQRIARSQAFELLTFAVIGLNLLWISIDSDLNEASSLIDAHIVFQVADNAFCLYFSFELVTRFSAFDNKLRAFRDNWFCFDSFLLILMITETWVMTAVLLFSGAETTGGGMGNASIVRLVRMLRITRMARLARLARSMPELMILIRGMVAAARAVFFTLLLLVIIIYFFAIGFRLLCDGTPVGETYFSSTPLAMHTLLVQGMFMDDMTDLVNQILQEVPLMLCVWYVYVLIGSLTLLNMLIGILCEVITGVASEEKETATIANVKDVLTRIMDSSTFDKDEDGRISKDEFLSLLENPLANTLLSQVGVDVVGVVGFADFIFEGEHADDDPITLSTEDLLKLFLDMRGSNSATVRDIVDLRKYVKEQFLALEARAERKSVAQGARPSVFSSPSDGFGRTSCSMTQSQSNMSQNGSMGPVPEGRASIERQGSNGQVEQIQEVLQKLLNSSTAELKKWMKIELRLQLGATNGACDPPSKECQESSPKSAQSMCLHRSSEGDDVNGLSITSVSLDNEEGLALGSKCDEPFINFCKDMEDMKEHLQHLMQEVDTQDAQLSSLAELVAPANTFKDLSLPPLPNSPTGKKRISKISVNSSNSGKDGCSVNSSSSGRKREMPSPNILYRLCSSKDEMQYNMRCVIQKADEQQKKFVWFAKLLDTLHTQESRLSSRDFYGTKVGRCSL